MLRQERYPDNEYRERVQKGCLLDERQNDKTREYLLGGVQCR